MNDWSVVEYEMTKKTKKFTKTLYETSLNIYFVIRDNHTNCSCCPCTRCQHSSPPQINGQRPNKRILLSNGQSVFDELSLYTFNLINNLVN